MSQVPSYQVPAHPSGLEMRTQLNAIVLALIGDSMGPTEPAETYPGMWWGDTTAGQLKRRTVANDGWTVVGPIDDILGGVRNDIANVTNIANNANANANNRVARSGDTMQGELWAGISAGAPQYSYYFSMNSNSGNYRMRAAGNSLEYVGNNGQWVTAQLSVGGTFTIRENFVGPYRLSLGNPQFGNGGTGYGEIELRSQDGTWNRMRGRAAGGGMEWVNHGYNSVIANMDDGGTLSLNGQLRAGGATLGTDGNLYMPWAGDWLSNQLNNRVWRSQCQHDSGLAEFGSIVQGDSGHGEATCPNPWVMVGLRGARWETVIRGIVLRNAP